MSGYQKTPSFKSGLEDMLISRYQLTPAFKPGLEDTTRIRTLVLIFFAFSKIISTFAVTNQIFLPLRLFDFY